jgi:branched-chain amino acid aminotransferase
MTTSLGTHDFVADTRNETILINVNGQLLRRAEAMVSVFDSGFMLGDGVWEGLRVHAGRIAFLDQHLERLWEGAKAIYMDIGITRDELERRIYATIDANQMSACHIRLMVTRGLRSTPYQDPRVVVSPATIVIIAEYKDPLPTTIEKGIRLATVHVRRGYPDVQDPKLNSHSKLNCITACIQATQAGADEALMLDPRGFVASCNSTNFFIVRGREIWTSTGAFSFKGITQGSVVAAWRAAGHVARECDFTLAQVYSADEAFVTGTLGGVTPVTRVDGRVIGDGGPGPVTREASDLYLASV